MINIQEVRAGNQVVFNASGSTVTVLKVEDDTILLDTFPKGSHCSNNDISGIPLTITVLRKLSFSNEEQNDTWVGQGVSLQANADGFYYGLRISKSRTKMQYLHQLQNYITDYYALFREKSHFLDVSLLN